MTTVRFEVGAGHDIVPIDLYSNDLTLVGRVLSAESVVTLERGSYLAVARTADGRDMRASFEVTPDSVVLLIDLKSSAEMDASLEFGFLARFANILRVVIRAARRFNEPIISHNSLSPGGRWTSLARHRAGDHGWRGSNIWRSTP